MLNWGNVGQESGRDPGRSFAEGLVGIARDRRSDTPRRERPSFTGASDARRQAAQIRNECLRRNGGASMPCGGAARRTRPCACCAKSATTDGKNGAAADVTEGSGHSGARPETSAGTFPIVTTTRSQQPGALIAACPSDGSPAPSSAPSGQEDSAMITPVNEQRSATWLVARTASASRGATSTPPIHRARLRLSTALGCRASSCSSSWVGSADRHCEAATQRARGAMARRR
jgi:hypothetical protein